LLVAAAVVSLAACTAGGAPSPTAAPPTQPAATPTAVPTATPEPTATRWQYVVFGDSVMWGLQNAYAKALEQQLGVAIEVMDETRGGGEASGLLRLLTSPDSLNAEEMGRRLDQAEVITIEIPMHEYLNECGMDETTVAGTRACMTRAREQIVAAAEGIIDVVLQHRSPDQAMIRVVLNHLFFYGIHAGQGTLDEAWTQWKTMNDELSAIAAEHGIRVVSLWDALQGPDGRTDPMTGGLVEDGIHLTAAGIEAGVDALLASGCDDAPAH
jgi:lysophospholipase L1-like esterase